MMSEHRIMATGLILLAAVLAGMPLNAENEENSMQLLEVRKIWDAAQHNAFTDLIRFKDRWYCAFREGLDHVCDEGKLRVLTSIDGVEWTSAALMKWEGGDVRDAKLALTADGQLMLNGAVRFLKPANKTNTHQSVTWLSADGKNWTGPYACPSGLGTWRWSITWHKGYAYSFGYDGKDPGGCLYRSRDGKNWEVVKANVFPKAQAAALGNETSLLFLPDGTACCLLRFDETNGYTQANAPGSAAQFGTARPPYTDWTWKSLGVRIGGPKMIRLDDGRFLAAVRLYDGGWWHPAHTALAWIDPQAGTFSEALKLPSSGDNSYAGLVWHEGLLWMSYYSSHEGKTSIYLAKVRIPGKPTNAPKPRP